LNGRAQELALAIEVYARPSGAGTLLSVTTRFVGSDEGSRQRLLDAWTLVGPLTRGLARRYVAAVKANLDELEELGLAA
jgi:hypothetical protein